MNNEKRKEWEKQNRKRIRWWGIKWRRIRNTQFKLKRWNSTWLTRCKIHLSKKMKMKMLMLILLWCWWGLLKMRLIKIIDLTFWIGKVEWMTKKEEEKTSNQINGILDWISYLMVFIWNYRLSFVYWLSLLFSI